MMNDPSERNEPRNEDTTLNLDGILSTQPELGPKIPDGGYGWIVFLGTLFFQALIPNLVVTFGIFLAFLKLETLMEDKNPNLWDEKFVYTPLIFSISRNIFDSFTRKLVLKSTWPKLVATGGTCLTCAGLLFMWMGMTGAHDDWLYVPAGISSGLGSSLLMNQCEILVAQYFRFKLPILNTIAQMVSAIGFILSPTLIGREIFRSSLYSVLLWHQAIILQGVIVSLTFRKPIYLKSKNAPRPYQFVTNADDEEDIFSKNSQELQIKTPVEEPQAGPSRQNWEDFQEDEKEVKYDKLDDWETFDEDVTIPKRKSWEKFEDQDDGSTVNKLSVAEEISLPQNQPVPLFSELPVNNNNSYSYDDDMILDPPNSRVFSTNTNATANFLTNQWELMKEPTFYKSLVMMVANKYSSFVFFTLFPSYLYIDVESINVKHMTWLVGFLSIITLVFNTISQYLRVSKQYRALVFFLLFWIGAAGYALMGDYSNELFLLIGAGFVIFSISGLEHLERSLMGVTSKGETGKDYPLLITLSGLSLVVFLLFNLTFRDCFRMMSIIHFFIGTVWIVNFLYKRFLK